MLNKCHSYSIAFCNFNTRFCLNGVFSSIYLRAVFIFVQFPSFAMVSSLIPSLAASVAPPLLLECSEYNSPSYPQSVIV